MSNVEIFTPFYDGTLTHFHKKGENCRMAVQTLVGNDFGAAPVCLNIIVHTQVGNMIDVVLPYDGRSVARVFLNGKTV